MFSSYEVSPVEPLHDLMGHIKNVLELLPHFLTNKVKELFFFLFFFIDNENVDMNADVPHNENGDEQGK